MLDWCNFHIWGVSDLWNMSVCTAQNSLKIHTRCINQNLSVAFISKDKRQVNLVDAPCIILWLDDTNGTYIVHYVYVYLTHSIKLFIVSSQNLGQPSFLLREHIFSRVVWYIWIWSILYLTICLLSSQEFWPKIAWI